MYAPLELPTLVRFIGRTYSILPDGQLCQTPVIAEVMEPISSGEEKPLQIRLDVKGWIGKDAVQLYRLEILVARSAEEGFIFQQDRLTIFRYFASLRGGTGWFRSLAPVIKQVMYTGDVHPAMDESQITKMLVGMAVLFESRIPGIAEEALVVQQFYRANKDWRSTKPVVQPA